MSPWEIEMTGEYFSWFADLHDDAREAILRSVCLLEHEGPTLGRPHADTLKGSRIANLRELRVRSAGHEFRIVYHFNRIRAGVLLIGSDKKGRDDRMFTRRLIERAEAIAAQIEAENRPARKERRHGSHKERGKGHGTNPASRAGGTRPFRSGG